MAGIDATLDKLREKYCIKRPPWEAIGSGTLMLDWATRQSGIPRGCLVDLFGEEGLGKTTLALTLISERIKFGERCAFIDVEHKNNPALIKLLIPDQELLGEPYEPTDGDAALSLLGDLVGNPKIRMVVFDSLAAVVPIEAYDEDANPDRPGLKARRITQALDKIMLPLVKNGCIVIFINQMRDKMSFVGRPGKVPTGGNAIKYYASLRMHMTRKAPIRDGDMLVGHQVEVKIVKNNFAAQDLVAPMSIIYGEGIDKVRDLIECGVMLGVIKKDVGWYSFEDVDEKGKKTEYKGQGQDTIIEKLTPIMTRVYERIREAMAPSPIKADSNGVKSNA